MRGKVISSFSSKVQHRITPAYAGKRSSRQSFKDLHQDHPRLCGEKISRVAKIEVPPGSPPPMRGKVFIRIWFQDTLRITPAYAGKSVSGNHPPIWLRDHPRLCGEKLWPKINTGIPIGITPAYAGKRVRRVRLLQSS